jgi:murein DD-endopeptidase MepM/ murein hydrolase activator NlpD
VLRTTRRFRSDPEGFYPTTLAGNHVITRSPDGDGEGAGAGDVCALYAHLVPGSVTVAPGQRVAPGDVLGQVGHSGNSTAPHLHFQLMDSPDAPRARGIPCAFAAYDVRRAGRWEPVRATIPGLHDRIRHTVGP